MKSVHLTVLAISSLLLAAVGVAVGTRLGNARLAHHPESAPVVEPPSKMISVTEAKRDGWRQVVMTVEHDGHWFVVLHSSGIIHHPDCPKCRKSLQ